MKNHKNIGLKWNSKESKNVFGRASLSNFGLLEFLSINKFFATTTFKNQSDQKHFLICPKSDCQVMDGNSL